MVFVWAPTAILALMVKIAQVDFVTEKIYWDWTLVDWLRLARFTNNIIGLIPDQSDVRVGAIFEYLFPADSKFQVRWGTFFTVQLLESYGVCRATVLYCT